MNTPLVPLSGPAPSPFKHKYRRHSSLFRSLCYWRPWISHNCCSWSFNCNIKQNNNGHDSDHNCGFHADFLHAASPSHIHSHLNKCLKSSRGKRAEQEEWVMLEKRKKKNLPLKHVSFLSSEKNDTEKPGNKTSLCRLIISEKLVAWSLRLMLCFVFPLWFPNVRWSHADT